MAAFLGRASHLPRLEPAASRFRRSIPSPGGTACKAPCAARSLPPKYYILDMFPYPSGAGLHVGHPEGYTATDILARYRRALGFNVLHPMGWDAFGLPAEQYAIRTGQHPRQTTEANIAVFKRQIKVPRFQLRLEPRNRHDRPRLFQMDPVDFPQALQFLVQPGHQQSRAN